MMTRLLLFFLLLSTCSFAQRCVDFNITTTNQLELPDCNESNGTIILANVNGGRPPYNFSLDTIRNQTGIFTDLPVGEYSIFIRDGQGCIDTLFIDFNYKNLDEIIRPNNAFTPNGDNINDLWVINGINSFPNAVVRVFNRYGQLLYSNQNYSNDAGWDGTQNGRRIPVGTYFYVISAVNTCAEEYIRGTVTIAR